MDNEFEPAADRVPPPPPLPDLRSPLDLTPASWTAGAGGPSRQWGRLALAAAVVVALIAGAIVFLLPRGGGGAAFALQYKTDQTIRYHMTMTMDGLLSSAELGADEPFKGSFDLTLSMHVVSVDANGTATIDLSIEKGTAIFGGQKQPLPRDFQARIQIAKDGRLLSGGGLSETTGFSGFSLPGSDQFTPLLPDHPVKPGDVWTKDFEVPFPFGGGSIRYSSRNELVRYEDVDGARAAVIHSDLTIPLDITMDLRKLLVGTGQSTSELPAGSDPKIAYGGSLTVSMTDWFDPVSGQQLKASLNGAMDMRMTLQDFPTNAGLTGEVRLTGTMSMSLTSLPA